MRHQDRRTTGKICEIVCQKVDKKKCDESLTENEVVICCPLKLDLTGNFLDDFFTLHI